MFNERGIETSSTTGELKIYFSGISEIAETGEYFYMKLKSGNTIIIPKKKLEDKEKVENKIREITENYKIKFISELNWIWK